jgi:hypothetical protein
VIDRLAVALAADRFTEKRGKTLVLRYAATRAALVTVDVMRNSKRAGRVRATAREGHNAVRLKLKKAGRYILALTARSDDGQVATDRAQLRVH